MTARTLTITTSTKLVTEECCSCHVLFAMPEDMHRQRVDDHRDFYCPNGHNQHYVGKTEAQKLREQLEREKGRTSSLLASRDQARAEADHQAARAAGYKGALTRTKKRVAGGVCPCCNRSFVDLARHMAGQHPAYTDQETPTP